MSMATRTDTRSSARHAADSHDLVGCRARRVNNLKDVSVEIPKRRLTTGVSGSGMSSLVFDTIAAESKRHHRGANPAEGTNLLWRSVCRSSG